MKSIRRSNRCHRKALALAVALCFAAGAQAQTNTSGAVTGRAVGDRLAASVAGALIAVQNGAGIVRVHDVAATRDVLAVWKATVTGC